MSGLPPFAGRHSRMLLVVAGIIIGQCLLYGSALMGRTVLLPLDMLNNHNCYLPRSADTASLVPRDFSRSDAVLVIEPGRRFTAAEVRAGRWPLWSPYGYAGAPAFGVQCLVFQWPYVIWPSPFTLAWMQLLVALVAGVGAYRYCRDVPELSFWPSAVAAWAYPLTAFFMVWESQSLPHSAAFLPWIVWSVDRVFRRSRGWGGPLVAMFTYCLITGVLDVAGQALLVSGLYAVWQALSLAARRDWSDAGRRMATVTAGWILGFMLTAIWLLPFVEYVGTGARIQERGAGTRERPPIGISELWLLIAPDLQGHSRPGSLYIGQSGNVPESAAAGYAGLIGLCLLAPLAALDKPRRGQAIFWFCIGVAGMAWPCGLPGFVQLFNGPILRYLSFNRFVFATGWAIVVLAAIGLETLIRDGVLPSRRFAWPAVALAVLAAAFAAGAWSPPEPIGSRLEAVVRSGESVPGVETPADAAAVRGWFQQAFAVSALAAALAAGGWGVLAAGAVAPSTLARLAAACWLVELVRFAAPYPLVSDPKWYYPPIPTLERVAAAAPGRVLGVRCLPPRLGERFGLRDVRGYDAVDPALICDLLATAADPEYQSPSYARTQYFMPRSISEDNGDPRLPGVLDMLEVRYLIFRRPPPTITSWAFVGDDYWVWENPHALPRPFIPRQAAPSPPTEELLARLAEDRFDASATTFVDADVAFDDVRGTARIASEHPQEIVMEADMETPGLVVLADQWHPGWKATADGQPTPVHRVNHAIRGIAVPRGKTTIVMRYDPQSFRSGRLVSLLAVGLLLAWGGRVWYCRPRQCAG